MFKCIRTVSKSNYLIVTLTFACVLAGSLGVVGDANAQAGKSSLLVILTGKLASTTNVSVECNGDNLTEPITMKTLYPGLALFLLLDNGTYSVTPSKEGYAFTPLSQAVTLGDTLFRWKVLVFESTESPLDVPYEELWAESGHADTAAEAFNHWNDEEEDPDGVSTSCAKCHSTPGFLDFLGEDGTEFGVVDNPAVIGTVVECIACHNDTTSSLTSVTFPSEEVVGGLTDEARCMQCHQGRSSTSDVDESIAEADPADDDAVDEDLGFINIHYYAAASTLYGKMAMGGYQYEGKSYDGKFAHDENLDNCVACHNPHSLEINLASCSVCHTNVITEADLHDIRHYGSLVDYDGDGDIVEGIYYEIEGLRELLYSAIQDYTSSVAGKGIVYDSHSYPYFFIDTDGDGEADPDEVSYGNRYNGWTARLVKAAYNFQVSMKDPGAFAHGGKYIIQLIYDSIEDLNVALASSSSAAPVDLTGTSRNDEGHFDGSSEAWRHWDEDGEVSGSCAKCHGAEGLPVFIENDTNIATEIANGMLCSTCHTDLTDFSIRRTVEEVTFPSGLSADLGDDSNLCLNCHQGRESGADVAKTVASPGPYSFINIHYYPAAATLLGTDAQGGYEFAGKTYAGQNDFGGAHGGNFETCVECHMGTEGSEANKTHNLTTPNPGNCACHGGTSPTFEFKGFRPPGGTDFDGDTDETESQWSELEGLEEALYAEMQSYATTAGKPIVYDSHSYPYFFNDTNGNGVPDEEEIDRDNRYEDFDAPLLEAAYNYQVSQKEPCGYIHNATYIAQLMVDSIEALGGDVGAYTWR
jgi:hypothetical protein